MFKEIFKKPEAVINVKSFLEEYSDKWIIAADKTASAQKKSSKLLKRAIEFLGMYEDRLKDDKAQRILKIQSFKLYLDGLSF